jgi:hypothetical protein
MMRFLAATFCCVSGFGITLGLLAYNGQIPESYIERALGQVPAEWVAWTGYQPTALLESGQWPPQLGEPYPDVTLTDQYGEQVQLRDFAGKVILVELAAIPCKGCQAFAGGNELGDFGGFGVQRGLESIHRYAKRFAGVDLGQDPEVVFVQLLLYGRRMSSPTPEEVGGWASHFRMNGKPNLVVLRGTPEMLGEETYRRIPGFHLIDRDFVLRYESSGHNPKHDLYGQLLPALGKLARREPVSDPSEVTAPTADARPTTEAAASSALGQLQ